MPIQRITHFKVLDEDHIPKMLAAYKKLEEENRKDGKPHILEIKAYQTIPDARSQGYSVVGMTKFKDLEDMKFYDTECPAHEALKALNKGKIDVPALTSYFEVP
ncbi:Putative stress responsive alpha-beta barrel [Septoria linicola]|uniref:Stress responsive alpha-beta barrel n=1 Tax=Septoria linicola TaxID=215465 RepID=A0A9Q9AMF2_9PEZI|nr:Putative stress responsive alpha-beta barrel [Septoria linicola]